jgi:DNA polymerase-3 subunit epsilon
MHAREQHDDLSLDACRRRRGLPGHTHHSAAADALACAELLLAQLAQFGDDGHVRLADLR